MFKKLVFTLLLVLSKNVLAEGYYLGNLDVQWQHYGLLR